MFAPVVAALSSTFRFGSRLAKFARNSSAPGQAAESRTAGFRRE